MPYVAMLRVLSPRCDKTAGPGILYRPSISYRHNHKDNCEIESSGATIDGYAISRSFFFVQSK